MKWRKSYCFGCKKEVWATVTDDGTTSCKFCKAVLGVVGASRKAKPEPTHRATTGKMRRDKANWTCQQ